MFGDAGLIVISLAGSDIASPDLMLILSVTNSGLSVDCRL